MPDLGGTYALKFRGSAEQLQEAAPGFGAHRAQLASEPAKICQASTDFATRLSTK
jgi:hypothetical protein